MVYLDYVCQINWQTMFYVYTILNNEVSFTLR